MSIPIVLLAFWGCVSEPPPNETAGSDGVADGNSVRESPDPETARSTAAAFHQALAAGDSARVLDLLHADAVIYESGHAEDVEAYRAGHLGTDVEFAAATDRAVLAEHVIPTENGLVYLSESRVRGSIHGRQIDSNGLETMLIVRDGDRWRIRHIHWSSR